MSTAGHHCVIHHIISDEFTNIQILRFAKSKMVDYINEIKILLQYCNQQAGLKISNSIKYA